jgi:hypothetical protein
MSWTRTLFWGFGLWLFGYILGFIFFAIAPLHLIGWLITPIGVAATVYVLWHWLPLPTPRDAIITGVVWAIMAIVLDYIFIVKLLAPPDGYYKLDVWAYYALTLALPLLVWSYKSGQK